MVTNIVTDTNNQTNRVAACEELHALALYASSDRDVTARALETLKPLLPGEVISSIDIILDARAMAEVAR